MGASAILLASKVSIDLQFGMFLSIKKLCIAWLYACAAFGVHAEGALSPVGCTNYGSSGTSYLQVAAGGSKCRAVVAELNKVDDIGGVQCSSGCDGELYTVSASPCSAAAGALNKFNGIDKVDCGVGYNIVFSFSFIVDAMQEIMFFCLHDHALPSFFSFLQ